MNHNTLRLLAADAPELSDLGLSTKDHWVFLLDEGMGDRPAAGPPMAPDLRG